MTFPANPLQRLNGNNMFDAQDEIFMQHALDLASHAATQDEVPVGAVLVHNSQIIGEGFNQPISLCDPSAHAEIIALRDAGQKRKNYRLIETALYVTLEPCLMCVGALIQARVQRVIFGAFDEKTGGWQQIFPHIHKLNHTIQYTGGLLHDACQTLLQDFFRVRR